MEQRSPFDHRNRHHTEINNNHNRYAALPPPPPPLRFPDDRDFYHHHQQQQKQQQHLSLPPPPPLPPPPQPPQQHPSLQYYPEPRFIEDRRPPPPPHPHQNRIPFEHRDHHQQQPIFIEDDRRFREPPPNFDRRFREPPLEFERRVREPPPEFNRRLREPSQPEFSRRLREPPPPEFDRRLRQPPPPEFDRRLREPPPPPLEFDRRHREPPPPPPPDFDRRVRIPLPPEYERRLREMQQPEFERRLREPPPPPEPERLLREPPPPEFDQPLRKPPPEFQRPLREPSPDFNPDVWEEPHRVSVEDHHHHHHRHRELPPPPPPLPPPLELNSDLCDPHRVSVDNRTIQGDRPPSLPPSRHQRSPSRHQRSPSREGSLVDSKRLRDNEENVNHTPQGQVFLFGKEILDTRNQKEGFLWGNKNDRANNSSNDDNFKRETILSSQFSFGKGKFSSNGEGSLGQIVKWGSAKTSQRDFGVEDKGFEDPVDDEGNQGFNGKRFYNQSKNGKFKNMVKREGSQEFGYSPKKKVQRTSALLRVGKTPVKWKEEGTSSGKFFDESNAGSFSHRGPLDFLEDGVDEIKAESSVDLDVVFKSNALVAKAIVLPDDHMVGSDGMRTPNSIKKRRLVTPVYSDSSPRVTEVHESSSSGDGSPQKLGTVSSSKEGLIHSKDKGAVSQTGTAAGVSSLACLDEIQVPIEKSVTERTPLSDTCDTKPSNGDGSPRKLVAASSSKKGLSHFKDKATVGKIGTTVGIGSQPRRDGITLPLEKGVTERSHNGVATGSDMKLLNRGSPSQNGDYISNSKKSVMQPEKKVSVSGTGTTGGVASQPCLSKSTTLVEKSREEISLLSATVGSDKKPLNEDNLMLKLNAVSACRKGSTQSSNKGTITGAGVRDDIVSQPCLKGVGVGGLHENSPTEITPLNNTVCSAQILDRDCSTQSSKVMQSKESVSISGNVIGDDIGTQLSLSATGKTPFCSEHCSDENPLIESESTQNSGVALRCDNGLCLISSRDDVRSGTRDVIASQTYLNELTVSHDTIRKGKTALVKLVGSDNKMLNGENSTQKLDDASNLGKDLCLSQSKDMVSIAGPVEMSTKEQTGLRTSVSSFEKSLYKDSSTQKLDFTPSSVKGSAQSKDEVIVCDNLLQPFEMSGLKTGDHIGSQPCHGISEMTMAEKSLLHFMVGTDVVCAPKTKKRRNRKKNNEVTVPNSGLSTPKTPTGSSTHELNIALSLDNCLALSKDTEIPGSGIGNRDSASSHLCQNWIALPHDTKTPEITPLGSTVGSDVVCAPTTMKRNRKKKKTVNCPDSGLPAPVTKAVVPVTGLPAPASKTNVPASGLVAPVTESSMFNSGLREPVSNIHYGVASGDSSGNSARSTLGVVKSSTKLSDGIVDDVHFPTSSNAVKTSLEKPNSMAFHMSSFSLKETEIVKAVVSIDREKANPSSDTGIVQSEEKVTLSGVGSMGNVGVQSFNGMNISLVDDPEVKLFSSPRCGYADTPKKMRRKKKKCVDDISTHSADYALSSNKELRHSEEQATASNIKVIEDADLQSLHRVTVSHEGSAMVESLMSAAVDSAEDPIFKKNAFERLSGFPRSRVTEIQEGLRNSDTSMCVDAFLDSDDCTPKYEEKNTSSSDVVIEKCNHQSLHDVVGKSVAVALSNPLVASAEKPKVKEKIKVTKKIKKKPKLISSISGLGGSKETRTDDEIKRAISCSDGIDTASISGKSREKLNERVMVSSIGTLDDISSHSLHGYPLPLEKSLEEKLPISALSLRNGFDDKHSSQPIITSSSFADSTIPNGHFPNLVAGTAAASLGFGSYENRNISSFVVVGNSSQSGIPDDIIESESGERKGDTNVDAAGELGMLGRERDVDRTLDSSVQVKIDTLPLDLDISGFNERSVPREEASGTSITNSNEGGIDSVSSKKRCRDNGPTLDPEGIADQTAETEYVTPKKTLPMSSSQNQQPTSSWRLKVGETTGRKTGQVPSVPKVLPGRASFSAPGINSTGSLTRTARTRTWHRTSNSSLPQNVSCLTTGNSQRPSIKNTQSTSYVRKGNSLVRTSVPATTTPHVSAGPSTSSFQLNHTGKVESKGTVSDRTVNCLDPRSYLRTGIERPKTPPLPNNINVPSGSSKFSQAAASSTLPRLSFEGGSETTLTEIQAGASENRTSTSMESETQGLIDNGSSQSSKMREITYVKRKSNQLVASCSTEVHDCPSIKENIQTLPSSTPNDQYFKKNKNQLIRTAPSLRSHMKQAVVSPNDCSNSESQRALKVASLKCNRNIYKRKLDKAFVKTCKLSKFSLVWSLHGTQTQNGDPSSSQRHKVYPYLFPWKRTTHWRNFKFNSTPSKSSFSRISKKLLLSRKRDTVYTRSTGGFSLRKSKVLSIGGSNLKWSKSIENRSKKANEEATLAVAAVERKKREQKDSGCAVPTAKRRNQSSRERVFRIGSVRYKMDASKRTLQRIPDEKTSCTADHQPGKDNMKSFIPKRLLIDNAEYIRVGNGNQLVRDPKKLVRHLASEKVRWSLHTARLRLAKKQQYCQFFTRFGKCNKGDGKCPYIHDPAKIAVCTKFLKGLCSNAGCKLTHKVIPERMEDCSYFLQGLCTNESCPYRHVNVNPKASVCEGFLRGYCSNGNECRKKHSYVCPIFKSTGVCPQRSVCKLHHPKSRNKSVKRSKVSKSSRGRRYFGPELNDAGDGGTVSSDKRTEKGEDFFTSEGRPADFISLDVSDEEEQDTTSDPMYTKLCDSDTATAD